MAAGAIGLVSRERPRYDLIIGTVAGNAGHGCPVVAGIIRRIVSETNQRYPLCRCMTAFAVQRGNKVRCRLAGCGRSIMATLAKTGHVGMVKARALPRACVMAAATFCVGPQMRSALAGRGNAIVTAAAGTDCAAVVKDSAGPGAGVMAVATFR